MKIEVDRSDWCRIGAVDIDQVDVQHPTTQVAKGVRDLKRESPVARDKIETQSGTGETEGHAKDQAADRAFTSL